MVTRQDSITTLMSDNGWSNGGGPMRIYKQPKRPGHVISVTNGNHWFHTQKCSKATRVTGVLDIADGSIETLAGYLKELR